MVKATEYIIWLLNTLKVKIRLVASRKIKMRIALQRKWMAFFFQNSIVIKKILQHMQQQSKHLNKRFRLILIRTGWSSIWLSLSVSLAVQSHTHKAACSKALHYLSLCNSLKTIALIQLATERQCELLLFWENSVNHRCVFLSLYFYTCIRIWPLTYVSPVLQYQVKWQLYSHSLYVCDSLTVKNYCSRL